MKSNHFQIFFLDKVEKGYYDKSISIGKRPKRVAELGNSFFCAFFQRSKPKNSRQKIQSIMKGGSVSWFAKLLK
jgi:hypothetical protein